MAIRSKNHIRNKRRWLMCGLLVSSMLGGSYSFAQDGAVEASPPPPSALEDLGLESVTPDDSGLVPAPEAFPVVPETPAAEAPAVSEAELGLGEEEVAAPAPPQVTSEPDDPFAEPDAAQAVSGETPNPLAESVPSVDAFPSDAAPADNTDQAQETPSTEAQASETAGTASQDTLPLVGAEPSVDVKPGETPDVPGGSLSGLEIAEDKPAGDAEARAPVPGDAMPPPPPKTEQGFQEMLNRKGAVKSPTADSLKKAMEESEGKPFSPAKIRSLFFTHWQHEALLDAKKSRGNVRPPTQSELNALGAPGEDKKPENRDLSLNGIVFVNDEDWTIWLNGMRVTPSAIPREIIDLRVYKEFIEVKWLDDYTNQIFPIRLRAHQRFNLDARIFLPG